MFDFERSQTEDAEGRSGLVGGRTVDPFETEFLESLLMRNSEVSTRPCFRRSLGENKELSGEEVQVEYVVRQGSHNPQYHRISKH